MAERGLAGVRFIFPDYENDLKIVVDKVVTLMKYRHAQQPEAVSAQVGSAHSKFAERSAAS
jgi:hypothetical protein